MSFIENDNKIMDPVEYLYSLCSIFTNQDPTRINDADAELTQLIQEESTVYNLITIFQQTDDMKMRKFVSTILSRCFNNEKFNNGEIVERLQQFFFSSISEETNFQIKKNLAYCCYVLYEHLHKKGIIWEQFLQYSWDLLQNPDQLAIAFYIWSQTFLDMKDLSNNLSKQDVFDLAVVNITNPDQNIRIQAATFIEVNVSNETEIHLDPVPFCNLMNQAVQFCIYQVPEINKEEVSAMFKVLDEIVQFSRFDTNCHIPLEFSWEIMQDESLDIGIRMSAANVIRCGDVPFLESKTVDQYVEILRISIEFTALLTKQTEVYSRQFEILYEVIWAISELAQDNFVIDYVLDYILQLKEEPTIENRILVLFLIDAIAEGSREYIYAKLASIITDINYFGESDDDFVIKYTCQVFDSFIEILPLESGIVVNQVSEYLVNHFPHEGTIQTLINLFTTVIPRPANYMDIVNNLIEYVSQVETASDVSKILDCIAACFCHPTETNEEIFQQFAPNLLKFVEDDSETVVSVLNMFTQLIRLSPQSTTQDIETLIQLANETLESGNTKYMASAMKFLSELFAFLPLSLEPYMDTLLPALLELKENNPIPEIKNEAEGDPQLRLFHMNLLQCFGHMVAAFPEVISDYANDILAWMRSALDNIKRMTIAACEALSSACEGFAVIREVIEINILEEIGIDVVRLIANLDDHPEIVAYHNLADRLITLFPEDLNSVKGTIFAIKICQGLFGEIFEFMLFDLSQHPDYPIQISLTNLVKKLIYCQFSEDSPLAENFSRILKGSKTSTSWFHFNLLELASLLASLRGDMGIFSSETLIVTTEVALNHPNSSPQKLMLFLAYCCNLFRLNPEEFENSGIIYPARLDQFSIFYLKYIMPMPPEVNIVRLAFFASVVLIKGFDYFPDGFIDAVIQNNLIIPHLPLPVNNFACEIIIPFLQLMMEKYPDIFTEHFDMSALNMLCSLPFYFHRVPPETVAFCVSRIQQISQENLLAMLHGNQYLYIRLNRNIARLTA